jgi:hypothetical protein
MRSVGESQFRFASNYEEEDQYEYELTKLMPINEFISILFTYCLKINSFSDLRTKVLASIVYT